MSVLPRINIVVLYNFCSTSLAHALHQLGVHMGAPFWYSSDERAKNNFYEPWDLGANYGFGEMSRTFAKMPLAPSALLAWPTGSICASAII
jgi:hypothetical protein